MRWTWNPDAEPPFDPHDPAQRALSKAESRRVWILMIGVAAPVAIPAWIWLPELAPSDGWAPLLSGIGVGLGVAVGRFAAIKDLARRRGL